MKRADRIARRQHFEELQQRRLEQARREEHTKQVQAQAFQRMAQESRLARRWGRETSVETLWRALGQVIGMRSSTTDVSELLTNPKFEALLRTVSNRAPRIFTPDYVPTFKRLVLFEWVNPLEDWKPEGKARDTILRSLLEHLLCRFPTPRFLWEAFTNKDSTFARVVDHIAKGGSLYEKVQSEEVPIQFTRKMCHEFLKTPVDYSIVGGIRRVQVKTLGGDLHLFRTWMRTRVGAVLHAKQDEIFWGEVLQFLARNPMIDPAQVNPIIDYITQKRNANPQFSMKGRTVPSLMRDMEEWHKDLTREKSVTRLAQVYMKSGFKPGTYQTDSVQGQLNWRIREILTAKDLLAEGRELRHCVYSYAGSIKPEGNSIWSLTWELAKGANSPQRSVTIQVNNSTRRIIQYRGWCNAIPATREFQIIQKWATENGLQISSYNGW